MCCCFNQCTASDLILYVIAVIFPPLAVLMRSGPCSTDFLVNILFTLIGYLPGIIHAVAYITFTSPIRRVPDQTSSYYQEGWQDRERFAVQEQGRNYGTIQTPSIPDTQNLRRKDTDIPPPPYTE